METKVTSKQFSLGVGDFLKGLLMAIGSPVIAVLLSTAESGSLHFDWKLIGTVAFSSSLMYLSKNFFDKPKVVITDQATVKAVKEGDAEVTVEAK